MECKEQTVQLTKGAGTTFISSGCFCDISNRSILKEIERGVNRKNLNILGICEKLNNHKKSRNVLRNASF